MPYYACKQKAANQAIQGKDSHFSPRKSTSPPQAAGYERKNFIFQRSKLAGNLTQRD